jgi:hypothetical protein
MITSSARTPQATALQPSSWTTAGRDVGGGRAGGRGGFRQVAPASTVSRRGVVGVQQVGDLAAGGRGGQHLGAGGAEGDVQERNPGPDADDSAASSAQAAGVRVWVSLHGWSPCGPASRGSPGHPATPSWTSSPSAPPTSALPAEPSLDSSSAGDNWPDRPRQGPGAWPEKNSEEIFGAL